ncbi:MAG: imidazolonepropionase [Gemmatimonadaceae bacterium]|nr:imidazolonepropionase [Gemmatimonadaceae bacterium]
MSQLLFVNASQVVTCAGPARARRGIEMTDAGVRFGVAIAVEGDRIAAVAHPSELESTFAGAEVIDCGGRVVTPGLVDSHTHAIFGRARYEEQEMRASGVGYLEIARRGGGIHASVADLRSRSEGELFDLALPRILRLASYGSTTIEIKSGYGLSVEDELKSLRVIARLQRAAPLRLVPTWLGAHEIPLEFRESEARRSEYVSLLVHDLLPIVARERLASFADVFCEPGVFTIDETRAILDASRSAGLGLKLHADELEPHGGAELAVELGAVSADHLGAVSRTGIVALAGGATVATLLPGTMLFLGRRAQAPAREMIEAGAAVALATDFNPGTSPTFNFPLILTLGVSQLRMNVAEAIVAATVNGAAALGLAAGVGRIESGCSADLALWDAEDIREIPYWYGDRRCIGTWMGGRACHAC